MKKSMLDGIPDNIPEEIFETIVSGENIKIERIISKGHSSEKDFWYNQELNEFVLVIKGAASLKLESKEEIILKPGDYYNIKAHEKHRLDWTDKDTETIWLAVHYS
jgi:cupin 2 domain-containing protein